MLKHCLFLAGLALVAGLQLRAQIVSEALLSFPARTEYMEYDNLASLRTLPSYNALRDRFAGKPLEEAKTVLGQLGIPEDQVRELVSGSSPGAFYGLVAGTFSEQAVAKAAKRKGIVKVLDSDIYCPGKSDCVVFLEDSIAAFGPFEQLKEMLGVRQGFAPRLSSNKNIAALFNNTDTHAPVRGVVYGSQLNGAISDVLQDFSGWKRDWSSLSSNVTALGYGVRFDRVAHVSATMQCASKTAAALLVQGLHALNGFQSVVNSSSQNSGAPFRNMQVSSSGSDVDLKADTDIPSASAAGH